MKDACTHLATASLALRRREADVGRLPAGDPAAEGLRGTPLCDDLAEHGLELGRLFADDGLVELVSTRLDLQPPALLGDLLADPCPM